MFESDCDLQVMTRSNKALTISMFRVSKSVAARATSLQATSRLAPGYHAQPAQLEGPFLLDTTLQLNL